MQIHTFSINGMFFLLDINSSAVHIVDQMVYDMMEHFTGDNDDAVVAAWQNKYPVHELKDALGELHELMKQELVFAPNIGVP